MLWLQVSGDLGMTKITSAFLAIPEATEQSKRALLGLG